MEQYIDKAKIMAEIERIYNEDYKFLPSDLVESVQDFKDDLLIALNNLEVEEVDLEKELKNLIGNVGQCDRKLAKHFFELGQNKQKGG